MGMSEFDPLAHGCRAWSAGRRVGAKRPLKPRQVWATQFLLDHHRRVRDRALFDLAIDSKLRGCDVVKIKIGDIVAGGEIRTRALVVQQQTGRPVRFELTAETRVNLRTWLERRGGTIADHVFPRRIDHSDPLSTRQDARPVDEWVTAAGLRKQDRGTHSLRRTKASIIYKARGNLRAVQILLGHTRIENTESAGWSNDTRVISALGATGLAIGTGEPGPELAGPRHDLGRASAGCPTLCRTAQSVPLQLTRFAFAPGDFRLDPAGQRTDCFAMGRQVY